MTTSVRRAALITGPGFQDQETIYGYYRFLEEGFDIDVATKDGNKYLGKFGTPLPLDKTAKPLIPFEHLSADKYDVVLLAGGHEAPDRVRQERLVLDFVKEMCDQGKVVAGMCHGTWIAVSAKILKGRKVCSYPAMIDDISNAGAIILDEEVVTDGNIVTCSYYGYSGKFFRAVFEAIKAMEELNRK